MKNFIEFFNYLSLSIPIVETLDVETGVFRYISVKDIEKSSKNEIFFIVNTGGTKDNEIIKFNAFFADFDCPKSADNKFASLEDVRIFKEEVKKKLETFSIPPTFIVDTRNGYHIYWCLKHDNQVKSQEWKAIEKNLVSFLNADQKVCNPARALRVPFTWWNKDKNNPYYVSIHTFNDIRYSVEEIKSALNIKGFKLVDNITNVNEIKTIEKDTNRNIIAIKTLNVGMMKKILDNKLVLPSRESIVNEKSLLSMIDYGEFIGITSTKFNCILPNHRDNVPSANIFVLSDGKTQLYKCFGCGKTLTLIQLIKELSNCTYIEALQFLQDIYEVRISELDKINSNLEILKGNIDILKSVCLKEKFPYTYKMIKRRLVHIEEILELAIKNVNYFNVENEYPIFFCSYEYIIKNTKKLKSKTIISSTISLLNLLGIIQKMNDAEIPKELLKNAYFVSKKHNHHKRCNYYCILQLNDDNMQSIEKNAEKLVKDNITMESLGMEFVVRTYNIDVAKTIFPQHQNSLATSKASNDITDKIVKYIFSNIDKIGYIFERDIIFKRQWKKSINEILDSYGLKRVKLNKAIKESLGIPINGYPFIICRNDILEQGEDGNWRVCLQNTETL